MTQHVVVVWLGLLFGLTGIGGTFAVIAKMLRTTRGGLR
jgi:predicted tellurium resistance membrane protein TerC